MIIEYLGYQIKPHKQYPTSWIVVTAGKGGKIPDILGGMFTSPSVAKREIDAYLAKKELKNGKEGSQGRD